MTRPGGHGSAPGRTVLVGSLLAGLTLAACEGSNGATAPVPTATATPSPSSTPSATPRATATDGPLVVPAGRTGAVVVPGSHLRLILPAGWVTVSPAALTARALPGVRLVALRGRLAGGTPSAGATTGPDGSDITVSVTGTTTQLATADLTGVLAAAAGRLAGVAGTRVGARSVAQLPATEAGVLTFTQATGGRSSHVTQLYLVDGAALDVVAFTTYDVARDQAALRTLVEGLKLAPTTSSTPPAPTSAG